MEKQDRKEVEDFLDSYHRLLEKGAIDFKGVRELEKQGMEFCRNRRMIENPEALAKEYLNEEEGHMAYGRVLEDDSTAIQALSFVADYYGKDQAWVDEVKNNNYFHAKKVSEAYDNHPVQKSMKQEGTFRKEVIKQATTPNQQLRGLYGSKKLHNKLNQLTEAKDTLELKVGDLEAQATVNESKLDDTRLSLGLNPLTDKEKAGILKGKNFTQKFIAEYLGVNVRTIRRWWDKI